MDDSGLYIAIFHLARGRAISVGQLGKFDFPVGFYLYVGSAQRNLQARLDRHGRRDKLLRWHIDYLTAHAKMLGAIVIAEPKEMECQIARKLSRKLERPIPRFGSSDCKCDGHLFYSPIFPGDDLLANA